MTGAANKWCWNKRNSFECARADDSRTAKELEALCVNFSRNWRMKLPCALSKIRLNSVGFKQDRKGSKKMCRFDLVQCFEIWFHTPPPHLQTNKKPHPSSWIPDTSSWRIWAAWVPKHNWKAMNNYVFPWQRILVCYLRCCLSLSLKLLQPFSW